jgi:phenylpropionate dioxygenase-like ring-hydroxylating dioxygenase large terminal subunit
MAETFLRNCWYAAAWINDLGAKPLGRRILNEPVVLWRGAGGNPVAFSDRCAHRAAPLSRGECVDGKLRCGYHGLQFDASGACVQVPGQDRVPPDTSVRTYPVVERWNAVWIWMGEPAQADAGLIPDLFWLDDPGWTPTPGYLHCKGNYRLIVDNLLDLTHVAYLHRTTLNGDPREATVPTKTERNGKTVTVGRWMLDFTPPPLFARAGGFTGKVDRWQFVTWQAPSVVYLDVGCAEAGTGAPQGNRSRGISIWSTHLLTPETEESTHYHFGYSRNFQLGDPAMSKLLFEGSRAAFMEDVDMIEAQQKNLAGGRIDGLADIVADTAQLQARRILDGLIAEEGEGREGA